MVALYSSAQTEGLVGVMRIQDMCGKIIEIQDTDRKINRGTEYLKNKCGDIQCEV